MKCHGVDLHRREPSPSGFLKLFNSRLEGFRQSSQDRFRLFQAAKDAVLGIVIFKVRAYVRVVEDDIDTLVGQMIRRPDTGQHEQMGRADRSGRDDDF